MLRYRLGGISMSRILAIVEKGIVNVLMVLMVIVLIFATIDLIYTLVIGLVGPPLLVLTLESLLEVFGAFLLVIVGLELLDTIKTYCRKQVVHAEVVLLAAVIAIARKAITLDFKVLTPTTAFGIAGLILTLSVGYFLVKHAGASNRANSACKSDEHVQRT
jgi:uncharacterized membrane protein (DUF373 family)